MDLDTGIIEINLDDIIPNRFQPRLSFDEKALNELSESIKAHGIIQPLVLRKIGDKYEIIAGERRYKAAGMAGLAKVPAVITNIDDNASAEVALVENIQRKNLTAIEEAKSYKNLLDKGYLTQDELAKRMGLSQSAISNKLRLLNLDEDVQEALLGEKISERHARSLLHLDNHEEQKKWLQRIIRDRLTVRQLDIELKKLNASDPDSIDIPKVDLNPNIEAIKSNAIDLNPDKESVTKNEFKDVPSEPTAPLKPEEMPRKFFNFLEDEAVNMSTVDSPLANNFTDLRPQETPTVSDPIEVLDMPSVTIDNEAEQTIEKEETLSNDQIATLQELLNDSIKTSDITEPTPIVNSEMPLPEITPSAPLSQETPKTNIIDPVSMIEKLDPEYDNKIMKAAGLDLNSAISAVRDCIKTVESKGFYIEADEVDFPNSYQIVINIGKDNK